MGASINTGMVLKKLTTPKIVMAATYGAWPAGSWVTLQTWPYNGARLLNELGTFGYLLDSRYAIGIGYLIENASWGTHPVAVVWEAEFQPSVLSIAVTGERNSFGGNVGYVFQTKSTPLRVIRLGRPLNEEMAQNHMVTIWNDPAGTVVCQALITPSSELDMRGFKTEDISPVTLTANTTYRISSFEYNTGDKWYDIDDEPELYTISSADIEVLQSAHGMSGGPVTEFPANTYTNKKSGYVGATFYYTK
jgi:hypothetical protein